MEPFLLKPPEICKEKRFLVAPGIKSFGLQNVGQESTIYHD